MNTILTLIIWLLICLITINLPIFDPFVKAFEELNFTDLYYSERLFEEGITDEIILINTEHRDRREIAKMIENVIAYKPKVLGLNIMFEERKDSLGDYALKKAILSDSKIVSAYSFFNDSIVTNNSFFYSNKSDKGFINLLIDSDNKVVREFVGVKKDSNLIYHFSFPIQVGVKAGYLDKSTGIRKFQKKMAINYSGSKDNFFSFNSQKILQSDSIKIPVLKDAIVLMGYLGTPDGNPYDIEDKHYTPLNKKLIGRSRPNMFGLTIHANVIKMLKSGKYLWRIPDFIVYILSLICCFFSIMLGFVVAKKSAFLFDVGIKIIQLVITVVLLIIAFFLMKLNIQINLTPILILVLLGLETIPIYGHVINFIQKKIKWRSYLQN